MILAALITGTGLLIAAAAFAAGLVTGTGRGEQRAAARCDIAHGRHHDRPAVIWPGTLGHYEIRAVTPNAFALEFPAERTTVDAFEAYRDVTERIVQWA